jgi:hypothetical protein
MSSERYDSLGNNINEKIYKAVQSNSISFRNVVTTSSKRLDHYSIEEYGDSRYWWVIAAASGIGWWLQVPSNTLITIPTNIKEVMKLKSL